MIKVLSLFILLFCLVIIDAQYGGYSYGYNPYNPYRGYGGRGGYYPYGYGYRPYGPRYVGPVNPVVGAVEGAIIGATLG